MDEFGGELSSDVPSPQSPTGNGGSQDFENGVVRGIRYGFAESIGASATDVIGLPLEIALFSNAGQTTLSRKVILKTTRYGAGCTGTMTVASWNVVVVRSTP